MNELQKAFCDGAAMAYRDVTDKIDDMIKKCPPGILFLMEGLAPLSESARKKAQEVYAECERFMGDRQ